MQKPKLNSHEAENIALSLSSGVIKSGTFGPLSNAATKVEKPKGLIKPSTKKAPKHSEKKMELRPRTKSRD